MGYKVVLLTCASLLLAVDVMPSSANDNCDFLITVDVDLSYQFPVPPPPDELVYNDGSAFWLTWAGAWRGTWFNAQEFCPLPIVGFEVEGMEFWFYHHPVYPWDVSDFYAELWVGPIETPVGLLAQTQLTALHYSPVQVSYSPTINTEICFWILENTEMSLGGWPSLLGDIGPNFTGQARSFWSDDFFIWSPWMGGEASSNLVSLEHLSWGGIKSLYR